ncbi:MAG: SDR family NAD(P)-dependent oxidoreductase [Sulfolobales archaeon]
MKVAIVTGASSGIGRDLAVLLARNGYSVALASRRVDALERVAEMIRSAGGSAEVFKADLSNLDDADRLVGSVVDKMGRLDLLVNNAGYGVYGPIDEVSAAEIHRIFTVNAISPAILISSAAGYMKRFGGGCIVNISTMAIYTPMPWLSLYNASKAALKTLTDTLRIELKPYGIRVIGVYPGYVDTEFHRNVVLTETSRKGGWSSGASRFAPVMRSDHVAREIVRRIMDPGFNGDIVIGLSYRFLKGLSQYFSWLIKRALERMYIANLEKLGLMGRKS